MFTVSLTTSAASVDLASTGANGVDATVDADSIKNTSFAAGSAIPAENYNDHNPNILITGLREGTNNYKGLENYGTNKEKIMINGRTWEKWESREGNQILENIWIYQKSNGEAYLGIDIADTNRLRVQGTLGHGEEIETIVISRGFEIVKTSSNLWNSDEITDSQSSENVVGIFKKNVILVANNSGGFDVHLGGSDSLGLEGYNFQETNPKVVRVNSGWMLNIRSGPGSAYSSLAEVSGGASFEYLDEDNGNFHKIDYNGQVAWLSTYNDWASVVELVQMVTITKDGVNIRSGPSTDYDKLGTVNSGKTFEYLGETSGGWYKINYNGQVAWVINTLSTLGAPVNAEKVMVVTAQNQDWTEEPIEHTFGDWIDDPAATCTQGGTQKRTCTVCDLEETQTTNAKGHTEVVVAGKAATCTETGLTEGKKCSVCDTVTVKQTETPANGHQWEDGICSVCKTECKHSYENNICTVCGIVKKDHAKVEGYSISLGGNIAVNFHMRLSEDVLADKNATVVFALPNNSKTTLYVKDAEQTDSGCYVFTCEVAAKEMTRPIKAQVVSTVYKSEIITYSVAEYAEYILAEAKKGTADYVEAEPLVKAMLNYGAVSQEYFDYYTTDLANRSLANADKVLEDVNLSEYEYSHTGSQAGVAYQGVSLTLKSETQLNIYFSVENEKNMPTFYVNGEVVIPVKAGLYYRIKIFDIPAQNLDKEYTITVGGFTAKYSAFSYGNIAMNTDNEELKDVCRALYAYNQAANDYIK